MPTNFSAELLNTVAMRRCKSELLDLLREMKRAAVVATLSCEAEKSKFTRVKDALPGQVPAAVKVRA